MQSLIELFGRKRVPRGAHANAYYRRDIGARALSLVIVVINVDFDRVARLTFFLHIEYLYRVSLHRYLYASICRYKRIYVYVIIF